MLQWYLWMITAFPVRISPKRFALCVWSVGVRGGLGKILNLKILLTDWTKTFNAFFSPAVWGERLLSVNVRHVGACIINVVI